MKFDFYKLNFLSLTTYVSLLSLLVFLAMRVLLIFSYSSDIGGIENNVIYSISKVLYGLPLFGDPEDANFDVTQYPPFYYNLVILFGKALSLSPLENLHGIYILSRTISLLINLLGGFILYRLLVKLLSVNKQIAFISCTLYFLYLTRIHFAGRPDALFSLLFIVYLYIFCYFLKEEVTTSNKLDNSSKLKSSSVIPAGLFQNKMFLLFLGAACIVLSIFTKQNGIQLLVIPPLFFLLTKNYKSFLGFSLMTPILLAITLMAFIAQYDGYFLKNNIGGLNNGISITRAYDVFSHFFLKSSLVFAAGIIACFFIFDTRRSHQERFICLNIFVVFGFAFATSVKEGSWINYYNEFIIATLVFAALEINKLLHLKVNPEQYARISGALLASYLILLMPNIIGQKLFHEHLGDIKSPASRFNEKLLFAKNLNTLLSKHPDTYFLSFDTDINCMLANRSVAPNKDIIPSQSKFDYSKYHAKFNAGIIKYIVVPNTLSINSFIGNDFSKFNIIQKTDLFTLLEHQ